MKKHTASKLEGGEWLYRGFTIWKDEGVPAGYYGRWNIGGSRSGKGFSSLVAAKAWVDTYRATET